jgi:hypothetical protein
MYWLNFNILYKNRKINNWLTFWHRICCGWIDMKLTFLIILLLPMLLRELSFAETYRWVDEKQVVHFTDDIMQIPEKYQRTIERIGVIEERNGTEMGSEPSAKKEERKEDSYRDRLGRGEEYWRARVEEWRRKLGVLQEKIESVRIKYNELTEQFNDSKESAERMGIRKEREQVKNEIDQYRIQIEEAREMLEKKIPEEAELYSAKSEWIKL